MLNLFLNHLFRNFLSGIPSECQTVCIQIRSDVFVGPDLSSNCLQMFEQTALVDKELIYLMINTQQPISNCTIYHFFQRQHWNFCILPCWWRLCRLLITFANSLDPDQNVCPDLDPIRLTLTDMCSRKKCF